MKKVAIFVEGRTEQIFIQKLIHEVYGYYNVKIVREEIRGKSTYIHLKKFETPDKEVEYYFLIVEVPSTEKVVSTVRDNAENMAKNKFDKIIGLRDLYDKKREDKSKIIQFSNKAISSCQKIIKAKIILAVMEIEAWFLADPNVFSKINPALTPSDIKTKLKYDLEKDDPETKYNHPAKVIEKIYSLCGLKYRKREKDSYTISHNIDYNHLCLNVKEQNKIESFFLFLDEIEEI